MQATPLALAPPSATSTRSRLLPLALAAFGVVYGDIGTSPLYAIRECFYGPHALAVTPANVLGILSLVFWTLTVVVTLKYLVYVLRADNRGEGGILALMALVHGAVGRRVRRVVVALGLFGAALLYADGVLTPAVSVLGAMEGLLVVTLRFEPLVVPATVLVLVGLFAFQRRGTAKVGAVFGPVMLVWFATLAALGAPAVARQPAVLAAVDPRWAVRFFAENGVAGFLVLGAVFLVATGGEALYADLGHFGRRPIQIGWFAVAGGALLLNYFGQGALLLGDPAAAQNPFYRLAPAWALVPLLTLATSAAVIASQAIISGAFSLTRQAVQLGYLPRLDILHTSASEVGQIYVPAVNWMLFAATVALTLAFGNSSRVAAAYGVAITATMLITTLLAAAVASRIWGWATAAVIAVTAALMVPDVAFVSAALTKLPDGGWLPLAIAAVVFAVMTTWAAGRRILGAALATRLVPAERLVEELARRPVRRVAGTAVYLTGDPNGTPIALLHNLKLNGIVHERNVFVTVVVEEVPRVTDEERLRVSSLGEGFHRVIVRFGFMEDPDVPAALRLAGPLGLSLPPLATSYVLSHNVVLDAARPRLARWRRRLFTILSRNALAAESYFRLPPNRVVELGVQSEI